MTAKFLKSAKRDRSAKLTIEITELSQEQADELRRMFGWMSYLGAMGSSREMKVSVDGDGAFRARFSEDGQPLTPSEEDREEDPDSMNLSFGFN